MIAGETTVGSSQTHVSLKRPSVLGAPCVPGMAEVSPALIRLVFRVDRDQIAYLRYTLESYDGMALVSTVDPGADLIHVLTPPQCVSELQELLESLRGEEGLRIEPVMGTAPEVQRWPESQKVKDAV